MSQIDETQDMRISKLEERMLMMVQDIIMEINQLIEKRLQIWQKD